MIKGVPRGLIFGGLPLCPGNVIFLRIVQKLYAEMKAGLKSLFTLPGIMVHNSSPVHLPCISNTYRPINLLELDMAPLDEDGEVSPVFSNIFVVWERNSTVMTSSGVAGRARGHMYDYLTNEESTQRLSLLFDQCCYFQISSDKAWATGTFANVNFPRKPQLIHYNESDRIMYFNSSYVVDE